jgi:hypothetical protein
MNIATVLVDVLMSSANPDLHCMHVAVNWKCAKDQISTVCSGLCSARPFCILTVRNCPVIENNFVTPSQVVISPTSELRMGTNLYPIMCFYVYKMMNTSRDLVRNFTLQNVVYSWQSEKHIIWLSLKQLQSISQIHTVVTLQYPCMCFNVPAFISRGTLNLWCA